MRPSGIWSTQTSAMNVTSQSIQFDGECLIRSGSFGDGLFRNGFCKRLLIQSDVELGRKPMATTILPTISCARDFMTTRLTTLRPDMDVFHAIEILLKNKISGAPVVDQDRNLLGVFSEASSMKVLTDAAYEGLPTNLVHAFMDWEPVTITPDTQLFSIIHSMIQNNRRRLPVLDGNRLVGQISRRDIMREASKVLRKKGDRESTLLYLSALREIQDTPTRITKSH